MEMDCTFMNDLTKPDHTGKFIPLNQTIDDATTSDFHHLMTLQLDLKYLKDIRLAGDFSLLDSRQQGYDTRPNIFHKSIDDIGSGNGNVVLCRYGPY
jgi:hypothetical protein